ncbi:MAG: 50S ribosomal protein L11 methyltransferase [Bacteroidales bacterium]|nr:50S ribosomal protein L11 methyltransferase [Bacteroidales bacterium]
METFASITAPEGATTNDYFAVTVRLASPDSDTCDYLAALLGDLGFESFVENDDTPGLSLTSYVQAPSFDGNALDALLEDFPYEVADATAEFIPGRDWNHEWEKNYFQPIVIAGRVAVHSSFHTDVPKADYDIVIDPRMAFGTGHHATTTLMMQALLDNPPVGLNVVDMGTGTGILAILASMLGARTAVGIEIDPFAADNAVDNVALNLAPDAGVTIICSDAAALENLPAKADLFLANINRNIITGDMERYVAAMAPGARLVVSGFYVQDRPVVLQAATQAKLHLVSVADLNNWSSMTFQK